MQLLGLPETSLRFCIFVANQSDVWATDYPSPEQHTYTDLNSPLRGVIRFFER